MLVASNSTLNPHKLIGIFFIDLDRLRRHDPLKMLVADAYLQSKLRCF